MLDEFLVTKRTLLTHVWTNKLVNAQMDLGWIRSRCKACILAASQEMGLEQIEVYDSSINKDKFKIFLHNLRSKYPFDDMLLVMDNLAVHRSREVRQRMDELSFAYTFTPAYSPQYNGVEEVINIGKQMIKKQRLDCLLNGRGEDLKEMIVNSFNSINVMHIKKCV